MPSTPSDDPGKLSEVGEEDPGAGLDAVDEPVTPDSVEPQDPPDKPGSG